MKRKILVVRFSSIGDVVLISPVLRALSLQAQAEVHVLTKAANGALLSANPYVSKLHVLSHSWSALIRELKAENFDEIIDLHHNLRSLRLRLALRRPSRCFRKLNWEKWLMVHRKVNRLPALHVVDRYFETLTPMGLTNDGLGLDLFIPDACRQATTRLPQSMLECGYVAVAVGSQHATKCMPIEILSDILSRSSKPWVLLGSAAEAAAVQELVRRFPSKVFNGCGAFSLLESAALIDNANVVLCGDTGLMHVAAALRKPLASVWGNTIPEFGMTPYYPLQRKPETRIFQVPDLPCRPCSKLGFPKCPQGHFHCMLHQNTATIADFLNTF